MLSANEPEIGEERLDEALAGLDRCDFVGLSDRLDESADRLARRLGWSELGPIPRTNVSADRIPRREVSPAGL